MASKVNVPFSNLRAVVILIVVAFHSALPYLASQPAEPFAFDDKPYRWIAFPIIDHERWFGFDLFCAWQDISLMTLMFFLAGLFVPASLARKGPFPYLADRLSRLGLPFVLAVAILSPLAYYASYRLTAVDPSLAAFWQHWRQLPMWPAGPQWFLWQVLALSALAAALDGFVPGFRPLIGRLAARASASPLAFFAGLTALSAIAYIPLALVVSPWDWASLGPLSVQESRPLHYAVYFFAGFAVGTYGCERSLLRIEGPLARQWPLWLAAAAVCACAWGALTSLTLPAWDASPYAYRLAAATSYPIACAAGTLAYLALALRLLRRRERVLDSLSKHAYGIYLVHYVFVLWLQYALAGHALNAPAKMLIVFSIALVASWATSALAGVLVAAGVRALKSPARQAEALPQQASLADRTR